MSYLTIWQLTQRRIRSCLTAARNAKNKEFQKFWLTTANKVAYNKNVVLNDEKIMEIMGNVPRRKSVGRFPRSGCRGDYKNDSSTC